MVSIREEESFLLLFFSCRGIAGGAGNRVVTALFIGNLHFLNFGKIFLNVPQKASKGERGIFSCTWWHSKITKIYEKIFEEKLSLEKIRDCHSSERTETVIQELDRTCNVPLPCLWRSPLFLVRFSLCRKREQRKTLHMCLQSFCTELSFPWGSLMFLVSLISYWYFSHVQKPINLYQQDGDVSITWPNSKTSLQVGLLLGTAASTRQHQGCIKQNNKTKQPGWSARYIWITKRNWIFWSPFTCTPSLCSSGAVLRPYRQAWTAVQSTVGS